MSLDRLSFEELGQLFAIAEKYALEELTVSEGDLSVTIRGSAAGMAEPLVANPAPAARPPSRVRKAKAPKAHTHAAPEKPTLTTSSPMTGMYYRSPSPDSPSFVEIGDVVSIGQTIGLIEAMKVFSEVPSEVAGRVVKLMASSGQLVQAGEPLIMLEPAEEGEAAI